MGHNILAIDDSDLIHKLLDARLRPEDVTIHHALDGEEGLRLATQVRPDLVLLDVDMPGMSGFEVCRRLLADPATASVPIIFLTGATQIFSKVEGLDIGAVDYVTKPFDPAELRARVRSALRTKRYHDMLATRAQLDGLTGLWNRGYFDQRLRDEVAAVQRYGRALSLVLIDLDHFKRINDTHGHPFGDRVLQATGEALTMCFRTTDAPCRYGGEEFAVILTETGAEALIAARRCHSQLAALGLRHRGEPVAVTASIGVVSTDQFAHHGVITARSLLEAADGALYDAKRAGRDRVCVANLAPAATPSIHGA